MSSHLVHLPTHPVISAGLFPAFSALAILVINLPSDGASASSIGRLFHCLTDLTVWKYFLKFNLYFTFLH